MSDSNDGKKRVTCKRPHPNQHLQGLLESLFKEAVDAGSKLVPALREAISSLEKYPLPLTSGVECAILKGFDAKLCMYIDSHLKCQKNKKSKVHENYNADYEIKRLTTSIENNSYSSEMASPSVEKPKKNRHLETNSEKCLFSSKFGEGRNDNTAVTDMPFINLNAKSTNKKISALINGEKNNEALDTYFIKRTRREAATNGYTPLKMQNICLNDTNNFALCENWESFTNNDCHQPKNKEYEVVNLTENVDTNEPVTEINSGSDEEFTDQPAQWECCHEDEVIYCKQCESITTAADAFQLNYKDKVKRDAEEIGKCVLSRKMYKPAYKSGAYAILAALLEQQNECPYQDSLTKDELIQKAQKHTEQSLTKPNNTAWTNAKRLINKGMVQKTNCEQRGEDVYVLTAMGRAVAMELVKEHTAKVTENDVIFHSQHNDRVPSLEDVVLIPPPVISVNEDQSTLFIEMPPGTFDIFMLIDKRENFKTNITSSPNNYCKYESRSISIGDFIWVARSKKTGQELVLPYVVERKRIDDLSSSIKDGRYNEQKFRLRKCGLTYVLYLIESYKASRQGQGLLPESSLMQAVVNTCVMDDFNVIKTESVEHTLRFLGMLSENLAHEYLTLFLRGSNRYTQGREMMTFEFFNKFSCKNKPLTIKDTFIKMLLQLKGLSVEKALAITNKYNSPKALMKAYERCTPKEGELLLANLKFNSFTRNVGPAVSKTIYKLFSSLEI